MNVLGLSFGYHDAAAALVRGGEVMFADQEERYSGIKNDPSFPLQAARQCMAAAGAAPLDAVVYYESVAEKFDRIVKTGLSPSHFKPRLIWDACVYWALHDKFAPLKTIAETLQLPLDKIHHVRHHEAHAASAFFLSPFERATVITLDGVGEWETATVSIGEGHRLKKIKSVKFPHSIGLLYSAFTSFLGFEVNEGEYKVMGMAAYGKPSYLDKVESLIRVRDDATFTIDQSLFDFTGDGVYPFNDAFTKMFGAPRQPESPIELGANDPSRISHYCDIAASVQRATENAILRIVGNAVKLTGIRHVCLAGGVALNSAANGRIIRELNCDLFVQPAAGDAGGAIGAALAYAFQNDENIARAPLASALVGREWTKAQCRDAIASFYLKNYQEISDTEALLAHVAAKLAEGKAVGWFQGRSEIGPRALGARSILADPRGAGTQARVNEKIKFREQFRPFAPAVLADRAGEYFTIERAMTPGCPESFMLAIAKVREAFRRQIPAVTHVDGTARVQTVFREQNALFYDLIRAFETHSGIPVLLNTSFNLRGKPIVGSPRDAIETFLYSGLDLLVLGPYVIDKDA